MLKRFRIYLAIVSIIAIQSAYGAAAGSERVRLIVSRPVATACSVITNSTTCKFRFAGGFAFLATKEQVARKAWESEKWIQYQTADKQILWFQSKDITASTDLKEYKGNSWPFRYLFFSYGDYYGDILFDKHGNVKFMDKPEKTNRKSHVFIKNNEHSSAIEIRTFEKNKWQIEFPAFVDFDTGKFYVADRDPGEFFAYGKFTDKRKPIWPDTGGCLLDCPSKKEVAKLRAFQKAIEGGDIEKTRKLLLSGMDVNARFRYPDKANDGYGYGETPIMAAADYGRFDMFSYLIKQGANVNERDLNGETVISYINFVSLNIERTQAWAKGKHEISLKFLKLLIASGFDVNYKCKWGQDPALHVLILRSFVEGIPLLLDAGVDINQQDIQYGRTPIYLAAWKDEYQIAKILLKSGANLSIKAKDGTTAFDVAKSSNMKKLLMMYKKEHPQN